MATRARRRVHALRRAPDGSAYQKCDSCGVSVAIALFDMHECGLKRAAKRSKVEIEGEEGFNTMKEIEGLSVEEQPRSPFCCFMENFKKKFKSEKLLEINRVGFDVWKNMSEKERYPYIIQAEKVNSAYFRMLLEESNDMSEVDDEADSAVVGKFDPEYTDSLNYSRSLCLGKLQRSQYGYKYPSNYKGSSYWRKLADGSDSSAWDVLDTWCCD